jgi:putative ABC transport system permease protein
MMFREIVAMTRLNLSSLRSRIGASTIIVVGMAGVVAVLLGLLSMSSGFRAVLAETARPDRVLIVRNGSNNEMSGWVTRDELGILRNFEEIDVASGEVYVTISVLRRSTGTTADVVGRGVTADAFALRPEVQIVEGRRFEPGKGEVIVGVRAAAQYSGLAVGDRIDARGTIWTVVGHFAADGTAVESEIWIDLPVAQDVFRRAGVVSLVRARLANGVAAAELSERLAADARLPLTVVREADFFAEQSASRAKLIDVFAYFVGGIMALGAVMAALNTMYTAVSKRTIEIATLRALGFGSAGVVTSVVVEAMVLALAGALLGAAIVYFALDGYATTTRNDAAGSQVAFAFRMTADRTWLGLSWALVLGFVGGLLPALRAARLPITQAWRRQ